MGAEERHLVFVVGHEGAEALLVGDANRSVYVGTSLERPENQRGVGGRFDLTVKEVAISCVEKPAAARAHGDAGVTRRVPTQGDEKYVIVRARERPNALEVEPANGAVFERRPDRSMSPLIVHIASVGSRTEASARGFELTRMDVDSCLREVGDPPCMIEIQMGENDVPHVVRGGADARETRDDGLAVIEARGHLSQPCSAEARGRREVVRSEARVDEQQSVLGLDRENMTYEPCALEEATTSVDEPRAGWAERRGVEMMNSHADGLSPVAT